MTKNGSSHPARFPEFLSRLHDGELDASERAHFESHRAHCRECRDAASQFEKALSLYRSARTSEASGDLAARILRRLEASTPRRSSRFGVVFGIDLKWAGVFAAALIAVIIGSSIVADRDAARKAAIPPTPISVFLKNENREAPPAPTAAPARPAAPARQRDRARASQAAPAAQEAPPIAPGQPAPQAAQEMKALRAEAAAPSRPQTADRSGGEGAAGMMSPAASPAPRLAIVALDNAGTAPALLTPDASALAGERGRRYFLLVAPNGRVREAKLTSGGPEDQAAGVDSSSPVWTLRFAPGDRPRRLLLRIE